MFLLQLATAVVCCTNANGAGTSRRWFTLSGAVLSGDPLPALPVLELEGVKAAVLYLPAALCSGFLWATVQGKEQIKWSGEQRNSTIDLFLEMLITVQEKRMRMSWPAVWATNATVLTLVCVVLLHLTPLQHWQNQCRCWAVCSHLFPC